MSDRAESLGSFEITGDLDREDLEALLLEARRLAARYGLELDPVRVEEVLDGPA